MLHLIEPLGFELDEPRLRRAGLDYREWTTIRKHASLDAFDAAHSPPRTFAFSTRGETTYCDIEFREDDALLFGPETSGLPGAVLARYPPAHRLRIPMRPQSRSLNLSNAVAVACYEAWRQLSFRGQHHDRRVSRKALRDSRHSRSSAEIPATNRSMPSSITAAFTAP